MQNSRFTITKNAHRLIFNVCRGIFLLALFIIASDARAADCSQPLITLSSQSEVDNFQLDYGGGGICDHITESLRIYGEDIVDLSGLSDLTSIASSLDIRSNPMLTSLNGLSSLSSIGTLAIRDADALVNLDGLSALTAIDRNVHIRDNDALVDIDGLSSITQLYDIFITGNPALTNIDGLSSLTDAFRMEFSGNPALTDVDGLSALTKISYSLTIVDNDALANVDGLFRLTEVTQILTIADNAALTDLDGLSALSTVGFIMYVSYNEALTNIDGLSALTSVQHELYIEYNDALVNVNGLSSLARVESGISIRSNASLLNVDGLSNLDSDSGYLSILDNTSLNNIDGLSKHINWKGHLTIGGSAALTNLDALSSLTSVGGGFWITDNDALSNIDGLSALASVGGELRLSGNPLLASIDSLSSLASVGGLTLEHNDAIVNVDGLESLVSVVNLSLSIRRNAVLENLDGLTALANVGYSVTIETNPMLTDINGLLMLRSIGSDLYINYNDNLLNINGLIGLVNVNNNIEVYGNPALGQCVGLVPLFDSLDDGEPGPGPGAAGIIDVGREILLAGNLEECNSIEAVLAAENSATFSVSNTFSDFNPAEITTALECQHPTTLVSTIDNNASISSPAEFGLRRFIPGYKANCTAEEHAVPDGYSVNESDCLSVPINADATNSCEIINTQNPVQILVNTVFRDGSNTSVPVDLNCIAGTVAVVDGSASMSDPASFTISDFPYNGTTCSATESLPDGYFLESSTCTDVMISPGNGASCTLIYDIDSDADGALDFSDNCPAIANPGQEDVDGDGIGDICDNCPGTPNPGQEDFDNDGTGDICETVQTIAQLSSVVAMFSGDYQEQPQCYGMIELDDEVLANVYTSQSACNLHRLDDNNGNQLLSEINTTPFSETTGKYPDFGMTPPFRGWAYFEGNDGVNGNQLWRTDGFETEMVGSGLWPDGMYVLRNGVMGGRLYFSVQLPTDEYHIYSTDGETVRVEPGLDQDQPGGDAGLVGTLFDSLFFMGSDPVHGDEPWVFNGGNYSILEDLLAGPQSSITEFDAARMFNDMWLFPARKTIQASPDIFAYYKTDGVSVEELPQLGPWVRSEHLFAEIKTKDNVFLVMYRSPCICSPAVPLPTTVRRINDNSSAGYDLGNPETSPPEPTGAALGDDALVLVGNRLFKLGDTSAEELLLLLPSDWESANVEFVGSDLYFEHAYIKETNTEGNSRIWAWNFEEAGLLMADETHVITSADHFRHIGNEIYFYGEDEVNGRALRKVTTTVSNPIPRMGAVTGSWFDPATSGQGLVLHPVDESVTVISFYGFEDNGKPLWLTGVGTDILEPGFSTEIPINITSGGNFGSFTPDQISEEPWGTLNITFESCKKGTAEFDGLSGQQSMDLSRLAGLDGLECYYYQTPPQPDTAGITGSWFDPATSGQGLVLHSMDSQQIVVSFYGYKNDGERLWLIGIYTDGMTMGEPLVVNMITASGGKFGDFSPEDITESPWGTLTINFSDCQNATATLDGVDGQQTMNMVKLAGLQGSGLDCH